jgi:predicted AlkP superfamily phosphohydrolase/phosphomutase
LAEIYIAVDAAIGEIAAALPDGADLIVHSPTGIGTNTSRSDLLPGMLEAVLAGGNDASSSRSGGSPIWRLRAALPSPLRGAFSRLAPAKVNRELVARLYLRGVDWKRTRAFGLPGDTQGLIRLNLRNRERDGIVGPAEAEALMEEIAAGLETFRDPDGTVSVAGVERVQSRLPGPRAGQLPDLLVRWSERSSFGLSGVGSPRFGDVPRAGVGTGWPGNHCDEAWAVVLPGRGSGVSELTRPARVADIAATASILLGAGREGLRGQSLLVRQAAAGASGLPQRAPS